MPRRVSFPEGAAEIVATLMQEAKTKASFQRAQCVWLRLRLGLSVDQIAVAVGWSPNTVRCLHSRFARRGKAALMGVGRGGRRRENLTRAEEDALLGPFLAQAQAGGWLEVGAIRLAYERRVGHAVPKSTVYRMLSRHGWRKLAPRPRHRNAPAKQEQERFKKNSARSSGKK